MAEASDDHGHSSREYQCMIRSFCGRGLGTGKMRVAKLRVGILRVEVRASTRLVSYF